MPPVRSGRFQPLRTREAFTQPTVVKPPDSATWAPRRPRNASMDQLAARSWRAGEVVLASTPAPAGETKEEIDMRFGIFTSMGAQTWAGVLDFWRHLEATKWDVACVTD